MKKSTERFAHAAAAAAALCVFFATTADAAPPTHPILLVHGLTGSADNTWLQARTFFEGQDGWGSAIVIDDETESVSPANIYALNMSDHDAPRPSQNLTFVEQGGELATAVALIVASSPDIDRVVLVGHSMGGLASRAYLESIGTIADVAIDYAGDVAAMITVGTPHLGTPLADTCVDDIPFLCDIVTDAFDEPLDLDSVALSALQTNSPELAQLNDAANVAALPTDIPYWSIIGSGQSIAIILPEDSDRVVPADSQDLANVPGTEPLTKMAVEFDYDTLDEDEGIAHLYEPRDPRVLDQILDIVNALAVCGDEAIEGAEACDDGNTTSADGCSGLCLVEACGDPAGDAVDQLDGAGLVTASDALFVLQAAVGTQTCAACVCDVNGDGAVAASDALATLASAVGSPATFACPAC